MSVRLVHYGLSAQKGADAHTNKPVCHFGAGISLWHTISEKFSFVCVKGIIPDKTLENDV
jgi:hypothetical protein